MQEVIFSRNAAYFQQQSGGRDRGFLVCPILIRAQYWKKVARLSVSEASLIESERLIQKNIDKYSMAHGVNNVIVIPVSLSQCPAQMFRVSREAEPLALKRNTYSEYRAPLADRLSS